jgi:hypothetical protein
MKRYAVDTNVPIVANGRPDPSNGGRSASVDCQIAAIEFLQSVIENGSVLLDAAGDIQKEYRRHLNPKGQPGVGDRFFLTILNSAPHLVARTELPKRDDGEYAHLPQALIDAKFDPSDRKFAALAAKEHVPVVNATDSDWLEHGPLLQALGIKVQFLCGCDVTRWFGA